MEIPRPSSPSCDTDAVAEAMSAKDSQAYRLSTKLMSLLDEDSTPEALWWLPWTPGSFRRKCWILTLEGPNMRAF
jgi:hypothetical protein